MNSEIRNYRIHPQIDDLAKTTYVTGRWGYGGSTLQFTIPVSLDLMYQQDNDEQMRRFLSAVFKQYFQMMAESDLENLPNIEDMVGDLTPLFRVGQRVVTYVDIRREIHVNGTPVGYIDIPALTYGVVQQKSDNAILVLWDKPVSRAVWAMNRELYNVEHVEDDDDMPPFNAEE